MKTILKGLQLGGGVRGRKEFRQGMSKQACPSERDNLSEK